MALGIYFAPSYFSRSYFPTWTSNTTVEPTSTTGVLTDCDGIGAIVSLLVATGVFEGVYLDCPLNRGLCLSASGPSAMVRFDGWKEFDDVDPISILRTVSFTISIGVRISDSIERFSVMSRLDSIVRRAISGNPLNGCLPGLTSLRSGEYDTHTSQPAALLRIMGDFSYLVDN